VTDTSQKRKPRRWPLYLAGVAVVGIAVAVGMNFKKAAGTQGPSPTFAVARVPLTISVSKPGTIKSRNLEVIKSEVEGQTTILTLVPEGTNVKKGDLLVELDASKL